MRTNYAFRLREELSLRAAAWAESRRLPHEQTLGRSPAVIFCEGDEGGHGNFFPASYQNIRRRPEWARRLQKVHTSAARCLASHDNRRELDTAASSDALLMSIFCHPKVFSANSSLRALLGTQAPERLHFGYKPRIPLHANHVECSEIDLRIGDLLIEAKLTESNFQTAPLARVERYRDLSNAFCIELLPRHEGRLLHYQLVRGALAAAVDDSARFCVLCDARRPDLMDAWGTVLAAVRDYALRSRLQLLTWQEVSDHVPGPLKTWLAEKYGICGVH